MPSFERVTEQSYFYLIREQIISFYEEAAAYSANSSRHISGCYFTVVSGWGGGGEICLWWRQTTQSPACFSSLFKDAQSWFTPLVVMAFEQVVICHFLKQRDKKKELWEVRAASQQTSGRMAVLSSKCVDGVVSFPFPVCICDVKRTTATDGIKRQCEICIWLNSHIKPLTLLFYGLCLCSFSLLSPSDISKFIYGN